MMKITKRQLRRIIKEEKAKLLRESITDMTQYQDMFEKAALEVSDKFYNDMMDMFRDEPEAFAGRSDRDSWEQQVVYAQQEIDTAIVEAMSAALQRIEMDLHDGQYDDGR